MKWAKVWRLRIAPNATKNTGLPEQIMEVHEMTDQPKPLDVEALREATLNVIAKAALHNQDQRLGHVETLKDALLLRQAADEIQRLREAVSDFLRIQRDYKPHVPQEACLHRLRTLLPPDMRP